LIVPAMEESKAHMMVASKAALMVD
jgi:hypothetical protein